jgi:V8-like Glu-specific endopeptidase
VFDLATKTYDGPLDPLAEKLVMIGYPKGMAHAFLKESHSMQPVVREVMVGMKPDRYSFEYQGESLGGASGSPIFNPKNGMLYGINWGRWTAGATFGQACKAPYVKELYEEYQDVI